MHSLDIGVIGVIRVIEVGLSTYKPGVTSGVSAKPSVSLPVSPETLKIPQVLPDTIPAN